MADHYVVLRWPLYTDLDTEVYDDVDEARLMIAELAEDVLTGEEEGEFRIWRLVAVDDSGGG
jgi:hypothetical protein